MKKYNVIKRQDAECRIGLYQGLNNLVCKLNELGYNKKVYSYLCDFYHYFRNANKHDLNLQPFFQRLLSLYIEHSYKKLFIKFFQTCFQLQTENSTFLILLFAYNI